MRPTLLSRLVRLVAIIAGTMMIGASVSDHASAQKGVDIQGVSSKSSSLFSFDILNRDSKFIRAAINGALDVGQIDDLKFSDTEALTRFYTEQDGKTLWIDMRENTHPKAVTVLHMFEQAWTHGLHPETYHVSHITPLLAAETPAEKARLELLISDGLVRYAHDLTGVRFPANALNLDPVSWRQPVAAYDALMGVAGASDLQAALDQLAPQDGLYNRLRKELITLVESPDRAYDKGLPITLTGILRPGDFSGAVINLRQRMGVTHDPLHGPERQYDDRLAAAVMKFQRQNGLGADGAVGPKTLELLNRTSRQKIDQIVVNMERLRWLEADKPNKYILVNIPSATLWAVENGEVALEMPVIVGRPERATKSFITEITGVRFNPKWTVPPTIKAKDFLPKLVEDPAYLHNKGIEVSQLIDGKRYTLDSTAIDWSTVTRQDLKSLRMVQSAGDDNALGRFRVLMENQYDIYLHDTNSPSLFSKSDRALSSGCIRMAKPDAVAQFILHGNKGWSERRMNNILATGRTSEISAAERIKVYILYQTIWQNDQDQLVYGADIYNQDRRLIELMTARKAYDVPENQAVKYAVGTPDSTVQ